MPTIFCIKKIKSPQKIQKNGLETRGQRRPSHYSPWAYFARALTIDEFPQLFNVLTGEMSMVGPRAYLHTELIEQVKKYPTTKSLMPSSSLPSRGLLGCGKSQAGTK